MNYMKYKIENLFAHAITNTERAIALAEENGPTNEQWFLNYMDELNRLSVTY